MPGENCLLCASDEGIFLDIIEQPALQGKARNCRLEKVLQEGLSTKVCHKCAFEIEQCNFFVEKVRKANRNPVIKKNCCVLCFDIYCKNIFFDLTKHKIGITNLVNKIRDLFPDEVKDGELQKQFICLSCRYCVDLLIDLRHLSDEISPKLQTIIQNGIDPADLPKTGTSIVNRKTTFIQSSNLDLNTPSDTDSECSSVMSNRKKINKVNKTLIEKSQRKCQQCKTEVKNGIDMYKIYRTGVTVCKQCWLTIDPGKTKTPSKKRKKVDYSETKLCSVLLEDVYKNNSNEKEYKIEKDKKGNTLFIVTDDSENESVIKRKTNKTKSNEVEDKQDKESVEDVEIRKVKHVRGGKKKDEVDKSIKPGSKRKETEQSAKEETEVKSIRSRRHKDLEQNVQEEIETKTTRSSRRRKESEESIQEVETKFPTILGKNSEQTIEENVELKITRINQRRKESEESSQDVEVRSTRSTRNRKDSDQSIQENSEIKSTRSTRSRKESEQSSQGSESKLTKSNKNLRDSEHSSQESIVIVSSRGTRRRKESEQSAQEDIEVNVDVDSDSAPVFKKIKRSCVKIDLMPKQNQSKVSNQNSATSEDLFTRKRGRSSSLESTSSIRRSTRNAKKNVQELDEIIEIDDDSNSCKLQKENVLLNEDALIHESKRSRRDRIVSCDEHSDTESNVSDIKVSSKRSSSVSSKESNTVTKFKTPPIKDIQENTSSESLKSNKFLKIRKSEIGKLDDVESLKSIEVDTSESEEIDVLKSTDEETKDYSIEIECEEKEDNSTLHSLKESESADDDDLKSDKEIIEPVDDELTTSIEVDNLKSTEENLDSTSDVFCKIQTEVVEKNSKFKNIESENSDTEESTKVETKERKKLKLRSEYQSVKQDPLESVKQDSETNKNELIKENDVKSNIAEKDTIVEIENDTEKEIEVADFNDSEINLSEDNSNHSMPESKKEFPSKRRSLLNTLYSRKSKSSVKKSRKSKNKNGVDDMIYNSDSETMKHIEQTELIYTCTICDKIYANKFIGLQHELTHMKTLEIKLQKIEFKNSEKNKCIDESDLELEISSKEEAFHSNIIDESVTVDNSEEKSDRNSVENGKQLVEKENDENTVTASKKEKIEISNEHNMNESSIKKNIIVDKAQINKEAETFHNLNEILEAVEENRKENGETIVNDSGEEKVEYSEIKQDNEIEMSNRRSTRRLPKKIEVKSDRKSRGKRKGINVEVEEVVTAVIENESDKIAEAVQETLNDMAELHEKIKESSPVKVPEVNEIIKTGEQENQNQNQNEISETKVVNDNENEQIATEKEVSIHTIEPDNIQRVISKNKEESTCESIDGKQNVENDSVEIHDQDAKDDSFKEILSEENENEKETGDNSVKVVPMDNEETEPIRSVSDINCEKIDHVDNECKLSKAEEMTEVEKVSDSNENACEDKISDDSVTDINDEYISETNITTVDKPSSEKNDSNDSNDSNDTNDSNDSNESNESKTENVVDDIINEDDDNNTEDEEALAQESLEELLQRKGLQIIDEFAESVTDGDDESEKESSEKENVPDKDIELDNELQIKISDSECTEILESNKSLSKQKEIEQSVVGESQIIQDVDVVEEVINDDDQPHSDVVQEVEVESNGNCVNVANNVVGQVLTEVFNMATVDLAKRLDLQTEPISDEEIVPETLENISREIRNSQDMPSLDPIDD